MKDGSGGVEDWENSMDEFHQAWDLASSSGSSTPDPLDVPVAGFSPEAATQDLWSPWQEFQIDPDADQAGEGQGESENHPGSPNPDPALGANGQQAEPGPPPTFPRSGDLVAGFHLVAELGRGAFARVFLAEQCDLADRRVALKVSRALGEEPRMLARLQHTHIVPIHSVHDDPQTGLRLMCMPYLGGANLAEVLETADVAWPSQARGGSLIEALDRLEERTSLWAGELSANRLIPASVPGAGARDPRSAVVTRGRASPSIARSALGRYWVRLPWPHRGGADLLGTTGPAEEERGQPARWFLRRASYVQAAVWITARLAEGLEHAHSRGLLHRDLKPSNILIAADGTPMLLDFNLSANAQESAGPEAGTVALLGGTLPYMAPEHLDAFHPNGSTPPEAVDERSDLYALGLILFEMLAGRPPFREPPPSLGLPEILSLMITERTRGAPSVRAVNPQVPPSLDSLVRKLLEPNPADRYPCAHDLAEDLRRWLDDLPLKHAPDRSPREHLARWARRHPRASSATSIGLVSIVLLLGVLSLAWRLADHLETASARLQFDGFQTEFRECQLLLNVINGPPEHLNQGLARADRALDAYGIDRPGDWTARPLVVRLPPDRRATLLEDAAELVLLEARARVALAERSGSETARRRVLNWAITRLDLAERFDPHPSAALFDDRARYLAALGQASQADHARARARQAPPTTSRDFYLRGTARLAHNQPDAALTDLTRAVTLDPRRFWAWFALGICHSDRGQFEAAASDFSVCTLLAPEFAWPHMNRGLALARAHRLEEARAAYDRALQDNPRFIEALVNRGLTFLELNQPAQAASDLERALSLGCRDEHVLAALGEAKSRLGHRAEAERDFAALLADHPSDPILLVVRGFFRLKTNPTGARADFQRALELDSNCARAYLGLAYLQRVTDPRAALARLEQALSANPNLIEAIQLRGLLRARQGDPAAQADVDLLLTSPTSQGLYNAACILAILSRSDPGQANRALVLLRRALALGYPPAQAAADPDFEPLRNRTEFRTLVEGSSL